MSRFLLLVFLLVPHPMFAQTSAACASVVAEAAAHAEAGAWNAVVQAAQPIYAQAAGCYTEAHGSLEYYLGRALVEADRAAAALEVWREGYLVLAEAGRFDARLAEAYLDLTQDEAPDRFVAESTVIYDALLGAIDADPPAWSRPVLQRVVRDVVPLLADSQRHLIVRDEEGAAVRWSPETGRWLQAWWRQQDPKPYTVHNERVAEHLRRVRHARAAYADAGTPRGYDVRGDIYVRFGPPDDVRRIRFADLDFMRDVVRFGVNVTVADFPTNEIWLYPHVDWSGVFIFYADNGDFKLGTATDLLAPKLRTGFNSSVRSQNRALSTVAALRYIYSELAMYHSTFGNLSAELDALYQTQDVMREAIEEAAKGGISSTVNVQAAGEERGIGSIASTPSSAAIRMVAQSEHVENQLTAQRAERLPEQYTEAFRNVVSLPVAARTARFLDPDGTTRTETYWRVPSDALPPTENQAKQLAEAGMPQSTFLLRASAAQQDAAFRTRQVVVETVPAWEGQPMSVQTLITRGDHGLYHLGLQWDQFVVRPNAPDAPLTQLRLTTGRRDSLQALSADPSRLVMSDLKPLRVANLDTFDPDAAAPYPDATLTPDTQLALYFEVYHLTLGGDDQAVYTVEYDVRRSADRGGLLSRLGRGGDEASSTSVSYRANGRTAREYILLDLSPWRGEGTLDVTLRITDALSGQETSRTISFDLVAPASE